MKAKKLKGATELVLRTVDSDGTAHGGFKWPKKGYVEAPDWLPAKTCGNGLHGCLRGAGDGTLLNWSESALWQVVEVEAAELVDLDGKVKFPRGVVLYTGTKAEAVKRIQERYPDAAVIAGTVPAGYAGTATAGTRGTATAGASGTATAGEIGTIQIKRWDNKAARYRIETAYIGEDGIEANTKYRLDASGKFVKS